MAATGLLAHCLRDRLETIGELVSDIRGILSYGAYVPRRRLQRSAIHAANKWFAPALGAMAKGERAIANWDEDAITMGVEASRDCLDGYDRASLSGVTLASVSHSFADRLNAGIIKEALDLSDTIAADDRGGSLRAGTSALLSALQGSGSAHLIAAADLRKARAASDAEMLQGDASAAVLVGNGDDVIARLVASHSVTVDFVDHYREAGEEYDYAWEPRWIREIGHGGILTGAIRDCIAGSGLDAASIEHAIIPLTARGAAASVAKKSGLSPDALVDPLGATIGDCGTAHPLLMLTQTLDAAQPGEHVLVAGFGQGADVMIFQITAAINSVRRGRLEKQLARGIQDSNYMRFLAHRGVLDIEKGMRAELDEKQPSTSLYRNRKAVFALVGARCTKTGTVQFPASDIGVNPNDHSIGTQEPYPLAERSARVLSYTADSLAFSLDPACYYGTIDFEGGGRIAVEFAEVSAEDVDVGSQMRMVFRIKAYDSLRHFRKYFWKATPISQGDA